MINKGFGSDNNSGVHPDILKAVADINTGHAIAYGDDETTKIAGQKFNRLFGTDVDVYFVFNGTAANVLAISNCCKPFEAVLCSNLAHIYVDECGAVEHHSSCRLIPIDTPDGKLTPELLLPYVKVHRDVHHVMPKMISISQPTELGTVYTIAEISAIAKLAQKHDMFLHVDGARLSNAAAALDVDMKQLLIETSVDIVSFGGTKNGLMFGEAVVILNKKLSDNFKYYRKQGMQLYSKMRFVSAQFIAYLSNNLWLENAKHSNKMARLLESKLVTIPEVHITQKVEANGVFARVPEKIIKPLQEKYFFYVWNETTHEVRWMCSFDTTEDDIEGFVNCLKALLMRDAEL